MNKCNRGILIGMVFGDSYLGKITKANKNCLEVFNVVRHRGYVEYKRDLIHKIMGGKKPKITIQKKSNCSLATFSKSSKYFRVLRHWMYKNNEKQYPLLLIKNLTDRGFCLHWMDDGNISYPKVVKPNGKIYRSSGIGTLSLYRSKETCEAYAEQVQKLFGAIAKIYMHKKNGRFFLRFNATEMKKIIPKIVQYSHIDMLYKFELKYKTDHERRTSSTG